MEIFESAHSLHVTSNLVPLNESAHSCQGEGGTWTFWGCCATRVLSVFYQQATDSIGFIKALLAKPMIPVYRWGRGYSQVNSQEGNYGGGHDTTRKPSGKYFLRSDSQKENDFIDYRIATGFRPARFQYKYPGMPTSTIAVPQKASAGRVMIVLSVQAAPTNT